MAWILRPELHKLVVSLEWRGRAGALLLRGRDVDGSPLCLWLVGWHGAHGDVWWQSAADLSFLMNKRPPGCHLAVCGDWNVDFLSTLASDPFADRRLALDSDDAEKRFAVHHLVEEWGCELLLPERVVGSPGGPIGEDAVCTPFTRVPLGANTDREIPSLLDYIVAGFAAHPVINWEPCLGDHAVILFDAALMHARAPRRQRTWQCADDLAMDTLLTSDLRGARSMDVAEVVQDAAFAYQSCLSCKKRRAERFPLQVRSLFAEAASAASPDEQRTFALRRGRSSGTTLRNVNLLESAS